MPQTVFIEISGKSGKRYATIVRNNAHLNITSLFGEKKYRAPDEDTLSVVPGFLGAYPKAFLVVKEADLDQYVDTITTMRVESENTKLLDNNRVRRTSPDFWRQGDAFHAAFEIGSPIEYGLFDYNRLENR